jgi:hypothetical protein
MTHVEIPIWISRQFGQAEGTGINVPYTEIYDAIISASLQLRGKAPM